MAYSWNIKLRNASAEEKEVDDTDVKEIEEALEDAELTTIKKELTNFPKSSQISAKAMLK
jgi:hypothetical protein